jgi:bifunctional non-homologous end joining protein LigD
MSNVMLAKQGSIKDLDNKDFIFEPKFDGTRVIIYKTDSKIKLINRRDRDITHRYPELKDLWKNIKNDSVVDGELVTLGKNHQPDFNLLQKREQLENETRINILSHETPATIFVFDILKLKNKSLTNLPLLERKKFLSRQIKSSSKIALTPFTRNGKGLWKKVQRIKLEGVVAKRADGKYHKTRSSDWLKIKNTKSIEAIIIGYTREKRRISALALGAYHRGKLIYIGKVAAGLDEKTISHLSKELQSAEKNIEADSVRGINFVKPKIVVEVKYLEVTRDLKLRAHSLLRIRTDKKMKECTI